MTILYGFTKDDGFAIVDTDTRAYLYGYASSPLQRQARKIGARGAALILAERLRDLSGFILRTKALNLGTPYEDKCEQTENGGYDNVFASLVAPQAI